MNLISSSLSSFLVFMVVTNIMLQVTRSTNTNLQNSKAISKSKSEHRLNSNNIQPTNRSTGYRSLKGDLKYQDDVMPGVHRSSVLKRNSELTVSEFQRLLKFPRLTRRLGSKMPSKTISNKTDRRENVTQILQLTEKYQPVFFHGDKNNWYNGRKSLELWKRDTQEAEKTVIKSAAATKKLETGLEVQQPPIEESPKSISGGNDSIVNMTKTEDAKAEVTTTTEAPEEEHAELPPKGAAEEEHHSSLTIFFILLVVAISILVVHLLIQTKFHYMPDSIAIVLIGALIGLLLKLFNFGNWKNEEAFPPTVFFIVLLPPIIFEGGYNLHKGNFFHNIGSILVFAVFGTVISAVVVGGGVYLLGQAKVAYELDMVESFAFGSLISAVDPVATLAIFQALDVDPILYMLVFGESMLNDAVSIVLTTTMLEFASPTAVVTSGAAAFFQGVGRFCLMFFASAAIGVAFGLVSAVITKFVNLHKTPSLEVGMVFCFSYLPYALAEGIHLSGIMAILFCGIVMSHYTHLNLSPVSQITVQQTFRTIAFICETCVFAYLGLAIFSFKVNVKPAFTIWSIVLILLGRAFNIFPLSFLMNFFRVHKITRKNQFIMWFSGLRGAVSFALSLHMELEEEKHYVLVTTTLIMVLFTIVFLGGSTMPLLKFLPSSDKRYKKKKKTEAQVSMSKTKEMGDAIDSEHLSELTEEDETHFHQRHMNGFIKLDARYLIPFFTKRFTQQEMREGKSRVDVLTNQWEMEVRAAPSESEDEPMEMETSLIAQASKSSAVPNGTSNPSDKSRI